MMTHNSGMARILSVRRYVVFAVLLVLLLAAGIGVYMRHLRIQSQGVQEFITKYAAADDVKRVAISQEYLAKYPASQLLASIDAKYADTLCHVQGHAIGRAIYRTNQNFSESLQICGNACTYGCFHGVLMEMFKTDSDTLGGTFEDSTSTDYLAHIQQEAKGLCSQPQVRDSVAPQACYHALGHVFTFMTDENLHAGVSACDILTTPLTRQLCVSGAFMEYMFATSSHDLVVTKDDAPCGAYPADSDECYRYKAFGWIHAWNDPVAAMNACDRFGKNTLLCIKSIAWAQASLHLINNDVAFSNLCGGFVGDKHAACIVGALLRVAELNDGDNSDHACDQVTGQYHDGCIKVLHSYNSLFVGLK